VLERHFIYTVGAAEEEHTTLQKSDVQPAAMEKQQLSDIILGKPRLLTEKECGKTDSVYCPD
jgi:hypothetical protein